MYTSCFLTLLLARAIAQTCLPPVQPQNGQLSIFWTDRSGFQPGTVVLLLCDDGYRLEGPHNRTTCTFGGVFYPDLGTCVPSSSAISNAEGSSQENCGVRGGESARVYGGSYPEITEFPWLAYVEVSTLTEEYMCTGVLVDRRWALVNYDCAGSSDGDFFRSVTVTVGRDDLSRSGDRSTEQTQRAVGIYRQTTYRQLTSTSLAQNDLVLIEFKNPFNFTPSVRPICLPSPDVTLDDDCDGVQLAGWGQYSNTSRYASSYLKNIDMRLYNATYCSSYHGRSLLSQHMCADSPLRNSGACSGDGVLICNRDQVAYALGMVNRVLIPCGTKPTVFSRVSSSMKWINSVIATVDRMGEGEEQTNDHLAQRSMNPQGEMLGWTLMHHAADGGDIVWVRQLATDDTGLFHRPANVIGWLKYPIHLAVESGHLAVVRFMLESDRTLLHIGDNQTNTPLHYAALTGQIAIVDCLIDQMNVSVDLKTSLYGRTPLHMAAFGQVDMVRHLVVSKRANWEARDTAGGSLPIHLAAEFGHLNVVRWFVENYPSVVCARNAAGRTPLEQARRRPTIAANVISYLDSKTDLIATTCA